MAVSHYRKEQQTKLFAQRTYDKQKNAKLITKNTEKLIDKAIKEGKTPDEIKKIFQREAKKAENYAKTAARTDATRLEGKARDDAYNEIADLGVMIIKTWHTITDGKQRDSHDKINREEQFADDSFSNGAKYPGDENLPPEERCNCRCTTLPEVLELYKLKDSDKQIFNKKIGELTDRILEGLKK